MDFCIESAPFEQLRNDCIIVGIFENQLLSPSAVKLDELTHGALKKILQRDNLEGKSGETTLLNFMPDAPIMQILLTGLGKKQTLTAKNYRKALSAAVKCLKDSPIKHAVCTLAEIEVENQDWTWKTRQIVETFEDVCYHHTPLKKDNGNKIKLQNIKLYASRAHKKPAEQGLQQGLAIAQGVALAKRLGDLPGNICTPAYLADEAMKLADSHAKLRAEILDEADMQKLSMGALLSVSRGSRQPAKLICLHYQGTDDSSAPVVLIGKGLTFDAGGISLKPGLNMDEMKYDMCGGAAVLGALGAAAMLDVPLNLVGLIPASENLPDGAANKPGDIVTSMAGKTIEILNTDAEGRLILCDTITYAKKFNPEIVIDMATLTGACIVALGRHPSAILSNDDALCEELITASGSACDSLWRLPLWEEYQEQLKSNFADIANIGGPDGGTITAACFLARFAEGLRWAHLDIAGTAWRTGANKGATGRPVPLLMQFLLNRAHARG
ncbi:MAG: leucyl aminopeptidase [Gammaproteobacteria bacterium]